MCHRADDPPVLNDRAAGHALHDAAGRGEQPLIRHADDHALGGRGGLRVHPGDLDGVFVHARAVHRGEDRRCTGMYAGTQSDGQSVGVEGIGSVLLQGTVDAQDGVAADVSCW